MQLESHVGESLVIDAEDMQREYAKFTERYPTFPSLNSFRDTDYTQLDVMVDAQSGLEKPPEVYLDYTGAMMSGMSHVMESAQLVTSVPLGNPHSSSHPSMTSTRIVEETERAILKHMNGDAHEYMVIFAPNASGATRLLAEFYEFGHTSRDVLAICADNHNSVHGIREEALRKGASVVYTPLEMDTLHMDAKRTNSIIEGAFDVADCFVRSKRSLRSRLCGCRKGDGRKLFAYPLQSNVSGVKHSLDWIEKAHNQDWDVFVDAAAFMPTNFLDLSKYKPDFIAMSFYKMFGHPTGVGALIVKRSKFDRLARNHGWFAGGTIAFNSVGGFKDYSYRAHAMAQGKGKFEDGTVNFSNFVGVIEGLKFLKKVSQHGVAGADGVQRSLGGNRMQAIQERVRHLTNYLLQELEALTYKGSNQKIVHIYGQTKLDDVQRGGTIPMNILRQDGRFVPFEVVETMANRYHISVRTGCFCNPGVHEAYTGLTSAKVTQLLKHIPEELRQIDSARTLKELNKLLAREGSMIGCIRVSVGFPTSFADVYKFVAFVKKLQSVDWPKAVAEYETQTSIRSHLEENTWHSQTSIRSHLADQHSQPPGDKVLEENTPPRSSSPLPTLLHGRIEVQTSDLWAACKKHIQVPDTSSTGLDTSPTSSNSAHEISV